MDAVVVKTEYTRGSIGGADYGSKARVVLRSPKGFIFVALGVHYHPRGFRAGYRDTRRIADKANVATFSDPEVRARIAELLGEGAGEAVLLTTKTKGMGTVLWQGGGDKLPLPDHEAGQIHQAEYEAVSPTRAYPPHSTERCLQCDTPLKLATTSHYLGRESRATTVDELQRLTNYPIVSVHGFGRNRPDLWPYIERFETWDGESYLSETFCSDRCAAIYGRRAAAELAALPAGGSPPAPKPYEPRSSHHHYDVKAAEERQTREIKESFARQAEHSRRVREGREKR